MRGRFCAGKVSSILRRQTSGSILVTFRAWDKGVRCLRQRGKRYRNPEGLLVCNRGGRGVERGRGPQGVLGGEYWQRPHYPFRRICRSSDHGLAEIHRGDLRMQPPSSTESTVRRQGSWPKTGIIPRRPRISPDRL